MDSSDDSFAWSDASKDSDDMADNIKEEAEESGIEYKRNLQEKLFKEEEQESKKKSKKRKHEETVAVNGSEDVKPENVKSEPESDFDVPKKKKKKKHNDDSDYSTLDQLIKNELPSFEEPAPVKSKKKKRHKRESETVTTEELDSHNHDADMIIEENHIENDVKEEIEIKKKKKSKQHTNSSNDDFEPSDDNFKAKKKSKKNKKQEKIINSTSCDKSEIMQMSQIEDISAIDSSTLVNNYLDDDQVKTNGNASDVSQEIETKNQDISNSKHVKKNHKISDRLTFEDKDSIEFKSKDDLDDTNFSKNLKQFIDSNSHLKIINSAAEKESVLSKKYEIWIIKAPHEVNLADFKDINMKLDTKSKLKINGQTYDLVSDDSIQKAPILMCNKNKMYLSDVPIKGFININKRIPKEHIPEENSIINIQKKFIPLPETKFRHPFFGVNYKKATKISPSVAERLNDAVISSPVNDERQKKKKHKKEKRKVEVESESEIKPLDEETTVISSKKKRKRKSSTKEESVSKKSKHIKNEESGDVWESEQAIEKNLFDF
ncbi:unnamed protein product [Euphydryas editha]|uniref:Uncharacterized protein n=1 Tax=Euphydryas editha TaxID=104508 RepID=A0AAU9VEA5_EUPED|nr:unnamed protein product [Euphydryas editha]